MAKGLRAADANGLSDPYCRVLLGDCKVKTNAILESLTPRWDETFILGRTDITRALLEGHRVLTFEVWDKDTFSDDFLGQVCSKPFRCYIWACSSSRLIPI